MQEGVELIRAIGRFFSRLDQQIKDNEKALKKAGEEIPEDELSARMPEKLRGYLRRRWLRRARRLAGEMVLGDELEDPTDAPDLIRMRLADKPVIS